MGLLLAGTLNLRRRIDTKSRIFFVTAVMTLHRMECEKAFCDVMLNFMFPDFIVVEAIPGALIHCEY